MPTAQIYTRVSVGRMMKGEKEGPALWQRRNCPSCATTPGKPPEHGGMQGLALIVACINYMDNSLGKVNPPPENTSARLNPLAL